jgi:hypothetical protein
MNGISGMIGGSGDGEGIDDEDEEIERPIERRLKLAKMDRTPFLREVT